MSGPDQTPPPEPELSPEEIEEIRAALLDSVGADALPEIAASVLQALGIEDDDVGRLLRSAQDELPAPDIAASVLSELGLSDHGSVIGSMLQEASEGLRSPEIDESVIEEVTPRAETLELSSAIRMALTDSAPVDLRNGIFEALELKDPSMEVGSLMREMVQDHEAPELVDAVMADLGLREDVSLGDLLGPDSAPDLWSAIEADLSESSETSPRISSVEAIEDIHPVVSFKAEQEKRSPWLVPSAIWAVAAAALVFVFLGTDGSRPGSNPVPGVETLEATGESLARAPQEASEGESSVEGSDLNEIAIASSEDVSSSELDLNESGVVIEELGSEANAFVQVLQFEADAPPIIFITELDDSSAEGTNEATL